VVSRKKLTKKSVKRNKGSERGKNLPPGGEDARKTPEKKKKGGKHKSRIVRNDDE